jgi:hypothetical protein
VFSNPRDSCHRSSPGFHPRFVPSVSTSFRSLAIALAIVACRDASTAPSTPIEMFDAFWTAFDREYSYFAYKGFNWDSLRMEFRPRAIMAESEEALIPILKQMVAPLRDVHVRFMRPDGESEASYLPTDTVNWNGGIWHDLTVSCGFVQPNPELGHCRMSGFGYMWLWSWNSALLTVADLDAVIDRYRRTRPDHRRAGERRRLRRTGPGTSGSVCARPDHDGVRSLSEWIGP